MARPHVELAHAPELEWGTLPAAGWPAGLAAKVLSLDADTGALSALLRLPPGWRRPAGHSPGDHELFVLTGTLRVGGVLRGHGWYEYLPGGAHQPAWTTDSGCELLFLPRERRPDFVPEPGVDAGAARIAIDTEAAPWILTPIPGPPAGLCLKVLRRTPTGGMTWLGGNVPEFAYDRSEFHDSEEESYCFAGDMWLRQTGQMEVGSYFWRPPYVTHGPFFSKHGCIRVAHCTGPLVNNFVDDPFRPAWENERDARLRGAPVDFVTQALGARLS